MSFTRAVRFGFSAVAVLAIVVTASTASAQVRGGRVAWTW